MNDKLLRELAPPLDAFEIGALFAPPPWGEQLSLLVIGWNINLPTSLTVCISWR